MDELIEQFDLNKCSKSGAKFDYKKMIWFNHEYMLRKSDREIAEDFAPIVAFQLGHSHLPVKTNRQWFPVFCRLFVVCRS